LRGVTVFDARCTSPLPSAAPFVNAARAPLVNAVRAPVDSLRTPATVRVPTVVLT
jgi:hypothetical protein